MNRFKSSFSEDMLAMLRFRKSMGYSTMTYEDQFRTFDKFCCDNFPDENELSDNIVLEWLRRDIPGVNVLNHRASFIRMFGKFIVSCGKKAYILPDKFIPPQKPYTPYILSNEELKRLFSIIDRRPQNNHLDPLQPALFSTLFRLIYTCGLRPNEGRTLLIQNVLLDTGEIIIKETKKHKERIVVMSEDMNKLMKAFANLRKKYHPQSLYFFPSKKDLP